jgi:hypothetical protein
VCTPLSIPTDERWTSEEQAEWVAAAKLAMQLFYERNWKSANPELAERQPRPQPSASRDFDDFEAFLRPVNPYEQVTAAVD